MYKIITKCMNKLRYIFPKKLIIFCKILIFINFLKYFIFISNSVLYHFWNFNLYSTYILRKYK